MVPFKVIHVSDNNLKLSVMKNAIQLSMFDVAEIELIYKSKVPPS